MLRFHTHLKCQYIAKIKQTIVLHSVSKCYVTANNKVILVLFALTLVQFAGSVIVSISFCLNNFRIRLLLYSKAATERYSIDKCP